MKIKLLVIGKTDGASIQKLIELYQKRIKSFVGFDLEVIPDIKNTKNLSENQQKEKEGLMLLNKLSGADYVVLLDDKGKEFSSKSFAGFLQNQMNSGIKNLIFIIGGPYGFSPEVYQRANQKIALSQMTFSHQLVRVLFLEQLYRGFAIINHHPYHHD